MAYPDPKLFPDQPEGTTQTATIAPSPTPQPQQPVNGNGKLDPSMFPDQPGGVTSPAKPKPRKDKLISEIRGKIANAEESIKTLSGENRRKTEAQIDDWKGLLNELESDQPGQLFPDVQAKDEQGLIPFGMESLKRGAFRVLPQQLGQAVDFMTDLGLSLDPFQFFYTEEQRKRIGESRQRLKELGFGGKAFEQLGNLVDVKEAPEEYRRPIKSLSELKDPKRAIQVIGEQGPAMIGNIAAVMANPAYGAVLMFGLEGGETYAGLNELEARTGKPIDQFEKLAISTTVGAVNAALEKLGIDVILGKVPGLKSRLAQLALSPITEATTEGLQEINQVIAEKTGERDLELTIEDLQRIQTAAYGGAVLGIVGGGSSQAVQYGVEAIDKKLGEKTSEDVLEERLDEAFKAAPILEGEQDAEGVRSNERQIQESGTIQPGGEAQGSQDIQQPQPEQPGRPARRQAEETQVEKPGETSAGTISEAAQERETTDVLSPKVDISKLPDVTTGKTQELTERGIAIEEGLKQKLDESPSERSKLTPDEFDTLRSDEGAELLRESLRTKESLGRLETQIEEGKGARVILGPNEERITVYPSGRRIIRDQYGNILEDIPGEAKKVRVQKGGRVIAQKTGKVTGTPPTTETIQQIEAKSEKIKDERAPETPPTTDVLSPTEKPKTPEEGAQMAEAKETPPLSPTESTEMPIPPVESPPPTKPKKHVPGERSFPKTLEEGELEGGTDRVYEVYADKKAIKQGKKRIEENEEAALRYAQDDTQRLSKEQVTTGILLLNKMKNDYEAAETQAEKENLAEKQVELANSLSRRLTQAGQSIQAASIVARLSPEGLLLYTQKKINQINKTRPETRQVTITPKDVESINRISKNIKEAVEVDENVKDVVEIVNKIGKGEKLTADELKRMVDLNNQLQKEYSDKPAKKKTIKQAAVDRLSKEEEAARKRLKERGYNLSAGIDPGALADFAIIGAAKVGKTGIKFLEWSGEMVSEFGEDIRPHLKKIFGKSVDLWKSEQKRARESRKLQSELNGILRKMESSTDITETELSVVRDLLDRIDTYSGEAREEALYELQDFVRSFEPVTLGRKLATAQTVAQLLNPKTNVRNILGNELFFRLERLNRYLTTPVDFAVSKLTGKERTVTFRKAGQGGFWAGFIKGAKAGWQGHNIQNLETQFNLQGQTFRSKYNPLTWMEKAMGATLRGFDFAAYNRAYNQFLGEQAELSIINRKLEFESKEARKAYIDEFMKNADLHIQEMAHDYGKYITFQDENRISNAFVGLKRIMNLSRDFGIGDFVLKYPKTPANLLARALEYSPAGIARSIGMLNKPFTDPNFRRREAMQALTRAITGTVGLTGLGAVLYSMGALSGGEDKDRDVRDFKAQHTGERNYQVNVSAIKRFLTKGFNPAVLKKRPGDYLVSYDWAQPVAISIAAGANMAKDLSENALNLKTFGDIAYSSLDAALNTLVEQPLVRGVQEAFGTAYGGSILKRVSRIMVGVPASFTPTFFSQVAQFTDNNRRISYDPNPIQQAMNKVIYKLPFVRENLKEVYKTLGGDVAESYKDGSNTLFNVFFNPAFVSKYSIDPEIQKVLLPYDMERRSKQFPKVAPYTIRAAQSTLKKYGLKTDRAFETIQLEPEDIQDFQKFMADDITKRFKDIYYHQLKQKSYEDQEKRLADEVTESYNYTKDWFFKNRAKKYLKGE